MDSLISHLQIANAILSTLLAVQLFTMPALRKTPKLILAFNCLLYAHQGFALAAMLNGYTFFFGISRPLMAMLLGPALYLYFLCIHRADSRLEKRDFWHFAVVTLLFLTCLLVRPLRFLIDYLIFGSFLAYTLSILWQVRQGERALTHLREHVKSAQLWLRCLIFLALANLAFELVIDLELMQGTSYRDSKGLLVASFFFLGVNGFLMFAALQRSHLIEWMYQFGDQIMGGHESNKPTAPEASPQQTEEPVEDNLRPSNLAELRTLFERWESLVKTEQLHQLDFGITLPQAARKLGIPARLLSNAVNQVYGHSFSVHLNDLRVAEAVRLLQTNHSISMTELMHEAGFSSKSNFNKEFLRVTGKSPSAFREAIQAPNGVDEV
ncbi:helix-turn-helix domain-containing protein [Undibacterium cyanobacteriorum]|uniref:Helix-turn-helix domain-containing protein n=1 Tax=Undibacterium cyanobacteriorum TaxID=3073561 RepID=A0ABY9RJH2_9BURK|nr:helix-turn-helix domain-containing protein [Undibacterium sp. 20NA77.5]WMW80829.1 helix-turn-helix domain-containing protein [Undibacterium sp. 20NA77.5]